MVEETSKSSAMATTKKDEPIVYIVYVDWPKGVEPEAFHIQTLAAVLGNEAAAKKALIHQYKNVATGFSGALTEIQAEALRKQPGVVHLFPSRVYHPLGGMGGSGGV